MSAVYREGVDDNRLRAVTDHVRQWLFGAVEAKAQPKAAAKKPTRKKAVKKKAAEPPVAESESLA